MYIQRKDQLSWLSKNHCEVNENEPKLTEEQEQEKHKNILRKLEDLSSSESAQAWCTNTKAILKPTNQNYEIKTNLPKHKYKSVVESEDDELPLFIDE